MKILIADDDENSRILLSIELKAQGYTVETASNGVQALRMAEHSQPELIISDILMPEMDGFEFCRAIRIHDQLHVVPFVFYSATYLEPQDEMLAMALGASRFIRKPIETAQFLQIIREVIKECQEGKLSVPELPLEIEQDLERLHAMRVARKLDEKVRELEQEHEALQESEAKYRSLIDDVLEGAQVGICILDVDCRIVWINRAVERYLGLHREEAIGKSKIEFMQAQPKNVCEDQEAFLGKLFVAYEHNAKIENLVCHVLPDGEREERWLEFWSQPISIGPHAGGRIEHWYDITERKQAERILRRSQKMDAVGKLTGGLAHDFNNLLGIIIGNLDFLKRGVKEDATARRRVETALQAALRGANLVRRLLRFSSQQSVAPQTTGINQVVEGMMEILARTLTPSITLKLELAGDLWPVLIDPGDLEDAILNIAVNARDAMPEGGRLSIETGNMVLDANYAEHNPGAVAGEYILLTIGDTGNGMTPEALEKAFEPFYTTKPEGKGTGLGLSMVYGFVQRSGGHIKIYSEVGHGTVLRIYLPRVVTPEKSVIAHTATKDELPCGAERVLVVDDDADLLQLAEEYLQELGYQVLTATNGSGALEVLAREQDISLLFSDVVMRGGMSGFELAAIAEKQYPGLKVLLTSGYSEKAASMERLNGSAMKLLTKPYRKAELAQQVRQVLDNQKKK